MVIEMLPALVMAIRAAAIANDNAPPDGSAAEPPAAAAAGPPAESAAALAGPEMPPPVPLVRTLRRRPGASYATAGNVILPLVFAERMPGWRARAARPCSSP